MNTMSFITTPQIPAKITGAKVFLMNKRDKQHKAQTAFIRAENKLKITRKVHVAGNTLDGF